MKRWTREAAPILAGFSVRKSYFREAVVQHQEHEINVALTGEGVYRLSRRERLTLAAGEILLLPAGLRHGIEVPRGLRMAIIHFHPDVYADFPPLGAPLDALLSRLKTWTAPPTARKLIAPEAHAALQHLTEEAVVEQNRREPGREALLAAIAIQAGAHFLRLMVADAPAEPVDATVGRILAVRRWIDRHFAEPCGIESLAEMAHLAPTYFAARFQQIVGTPPMTYVRDRRLEQAQLLLEQTAQPIKVVAWSVGFTRVDHFSHVFKQVTGRTPLEFRTRRRPRLK